MNFKVFSTRKKLHHYRRYLIKQVFHYIPDVNIYVKLGNSGRPRQYRNVYLYIIRFIRDSNGKPIGKSKTCIARTTDRDEDWRRYREFLKRSRNKADAEWYSSTL